MCHGRHRVIWNEDVVKNDHTITIELDLNLKKVSFSINYKKFDSKDLSKDFSDDGLKYHLIIRVILSLSDDLGDQFSIIDLASCVIEE